jgi:hypothetical protein
MEGNYFNGLFLTIPPLVSLMLCITMKALGSIFSIALVSLLISSLVTTVNNISFAISLSPLFPKPRLPE